MRKREKRCVTFPEHCRCCPGTDREVTNMVIQRSMNTVPMRLHIRRKRMDLEVVKCEFPVLLTGSWYLSEQLLTCVYGAAEPASRCYRGSLHMPQPWRMPRVF